MSRVHLAFTLGRLWVPVLALAALALWWAYKATHERPSAPVYPLEMWRQRRDVTVLGPRPYDFEKDDGGSAA